MDRGSTTRSALVPMQILSWLWIESASRASSRSSVAPGPLPLHGPVELLERRDGDDAQHRLAPVDQADADGPERQPVNEVAGAVDRVDRPPPRPRAPRRGILLAGDLVVREPLAQPAANHLLEVLIEVGDEAQVRLLDGRDAARPRHRHRRGLGRKRPDDSSSAANSVCCSISNPSRRVELRLFFR